MQHSVSLALYFLLEKKRRVTQMQQNASLRCLQDEPKRRLLQKLQNKFFSGITCLIHVQFSHKPKSVAVP